MSAPLGHALSATLSSVPSQSIAVLENAQLTEAALRDAAQRAGMTVVAAASHQFTPCGASCVLILEQSHFACHTWPEKCALTVSIHACSHTAETQIRTALGALATALRVPENAVRFAFFSH